MLLADCRLVKTHYAVILLNKCWISLCHDDNGFKSVIGKNPRVIVSAQMQYSCTDMDVVCQ